MRRGSVRHLLGVNTAAHVLAVIEPHHKRTEPAVDVIDPKSCNNDRDSREAWLRSRGRHISAIMVIKGAQGGREVRTRGPSYLAALR